MIDYKLRYSKIMESSNLNGSFDGHKTAETFENSKDVQVLEACKTEDTEKTKDDKSFNGIGIENIDVCVADQLSDDENGVSNNAQKEPDVDLHGAEYSVNNEGEVSTCTNNTSTLSQDVANSFCLRHDGTEERVKLVTSYDLECVDDENDDTAKLPVTEDVIVRNESTYVYNRDDLRMNASVNPEHVDEHWVSRNLKTFESLPFTNIDKLMSKSGCEGSVFHDLPDELIVKIFSYLTTKELCQNVATVCRKWRQISLDHSLWKSLDFSTRPHLSSLNFLWVIRRAPLLKRLFISGRVNITRAEVAILTESCPGIQEIDFGFCDNLTCDTLRCLPESCQELRKINVEGCDKLEQQSLKYLVKCKKLSHLNFSHCMFLQDSGIIYLADGLPEIRSINLDGISFLTDRGVKGLVDSHYLHLEEVELDGAEISDVGMEQLSRCKQLKHLGISFCECLTDQSLEYLKELKNLVNLRLRKGSDFSSDGLSSFFKAASLSKLQVLNLSECSSVNDQVVLDMSQACGSHLRELSLSWCWFITDKGLVSIVDHCCNMENLDLLGIDRICGECLSRIPEEMTKLKFLDLRQCNQILDNLIVDMVRRKKDLKVINYYGEEFVHD